MPEYWLAIPAGVLALLLAQLVVFLWPKNVIKKKPALPGRGYALIYADKSEGERIPGVTYSKMLHDTRHHLQGKPDMLYANGAQIIPVELKSGKIGDARSPREGDMMQLAVYFLIVEAEYGLRPREGRLIYSDGMFVIYNTRKLRKQLTDILAKMQNMLASPDTQDVPAAEPGFTKCRHCPCRDTVCDGKESKWR